MTRLEVIGVRHHSPACARLVDRAIAARPWIVLVEGPSDFNARLDELRLAHEPPIAIYSYLLADDRAHGSWTPFCAYSPEWRALAAPNVRFIDLPAWHPAFERVENRYADRAGDAAARLARARGFDSTDALWDHLFELTEDEDELAADLRAYFDAYRGDASAALARDTEREAYMVRWIDWALAAAPPGETVLVVCGGYHAPALRALAGTTGAAPTPTTGAREPEVPLATGRTGSYLVPFSFPRLDAFHGYASGMPSPAYYQALWDAASRGADRGGASEHMMMAAIARLRQRGQRVSTADAIAVGQLAQGLAQLRGHRVPARCDVLDGLAAALLKDALRAPVPWSVRAPLAAGTDPYLVEILAAFRGDTRGALARDTPQPPLVADVRAQCEAAAIPFGSAGRAEAAQTLEVELADPRRRVLYRLRWLDLPGVERVREADLRRGRTRTTEVWRLRHGDAADAALIERAVYGATLEAAALARIEEALQEATGVVELVALFEQALRAGYAHLAARLTAAAQAAATAEPELARAGHALARIAALAASEQVELGALLATLAERTLWLLEAYDGPDRELDAGSVDAVAAIRAALGVGVPAELAHEVLARRIANPHTPPAVRGACIGALWDPQHAEPAAAATADAATAAATAIRAVPSARLGDLLGGLFALAREAFRAGQLLAIVDERLGELSDHEFLVTLPALRKAFAYFPPAERRQLARLLLARHRQTSPEIADEHALLAPVAPADEVAAMTALEARWFELAARYRLVRA